MLSGDCTAGTETAMALLANSTRLNRRLVCALRRSGNDVSWSLEYSGQPSQVRRPPHSCKGELLD